MSKSTDPAELAGLLFDHVRQDMDVYRVLVVRTSGLSLPQYRIVRRVDGGAKSTGSHVGLNELREGGLFAELLKSGDFHEIASFRPDPSDPAFDLLQGAGSLIAFPIFQDGTGVGMIVVLGSSSQPHDPADLCALATMTSLLGRAIETQRLADQLAAACRALDSELKAAADVQRWLLPSLPTIDSVGIAASYRTARYSSGDYYDVGRLPDGRVGLLIADVCGKGAAAAVLMAVLRSIVHDELDRTRVTGPAALLDYADARLRALGLWERSTFITAFCGLFNPSSGELIYSSAGHNPPRLLRARDRTVSSLNGASALPLGILDEPRTQTEGKAVLERGDLALFYTDGITEARSSTGEFFDVERLDDILRHLADPITACGAVETIERAVARFAGDVAPADDQTLLALGGRSS